MCVSVCLCVRVSVGILNLSSTEIYEASCWATKARRMRGQSKAAMCSGEAHAHTRLTSRRARRKRGRKEASQWGKDKQANKGGRRVGIEKVKGGKTNKERVKKGGRREVR